MTIHQYCFSTTRTDSVHGTFNSSRGVCKAGGSTGACSKLLDNGKPAASLLPIGFSKNSNCCHLLAVIIASVFIIATGSSTSLATDSESRSIPTIKWDTKITKFQFDKDKFVGQRLTVKCPPAPKDPTLTGVFGTDHYPSESAICVAALHAGKITKDGGTVTIQLNGGKEEYTGSERNGVKTGDLPATKRSFSFVDEKSDEKIDEDHLALLPLIDWETKFTRSGFAYRHLIGQRIMFRCPPAPTDRKMRLVYGTDSYDFSSLICQAAMHAGKLTEKGGVVTVQIDPGVGKLVGSIRNGVETKSKGSGDRSISFVDAPKVKDN